MTQLFPGGRRTGSDFRVFGYDNIRRMIRSAKPNHAARAHLSIATGNRHGGPHQHKREIARNLRRAATRDQ
jgi:hypothetical protein